MITKIEIKDLFEWFGNNHLQINYNNYAVNHNWEIDKDKISDGVVMWVVSVDAPLSKNVISYNYEVYIMDIVDIKQDNSSEIESDTQLIALDLLSWFDQYPYTVGKVFTLNKSNSSISPYREKFDTQYAGNMVRISLNVPFNYNVCQIPFEPLDLMLGIANGWDNAYWNGEALDGQDFDDSSTYEVYEGDYSINVWSFSEGNRYQFYNGSDVSTSEYNYLDLHIYFTDYLGVGEVINVQGYDKTGDSTVGSSVNLISYMTGNNSDEWYRVSIPLSDMGLTNESLNAFRFTEGTIVDRSDYSLDNIQLLTSL